VIEVKYLRVEVEPFVAMEAVFAADQKA